MQHTPHGSKRQGFTLVEMLVVILLIAVLAGIAFRLTTLANERTAKAVTLARLAKLQAAIEEFYAEYGQYPPVPVYPGIGQPMMYEYPNGRQIAISGKAGNIRNTNQQASGWEDAWSKAPVFTFGLMSFLLPRYNDIENADYERFGNFVGGASASKDTFTLDGTFLQWSAHSSIEDSGKDNSRDLAACRRWWPYLDGIVDFRDDLPSEASFRNPSVRGYTNSYATVRDGWDHELYYRSSPPYQTYELYALRNGKKIEAHAGH
ncbi:MAG: type II secretion system protein [Kiritimatiellia bacterium]|jgi:prepilin-type N-terminal cleavage/methylation domain-containing protein